MPLLSERSGGVATAGRVQYECQICRRPVGVFPEECDVCGATYCRDCYPLRHTDADPYIDCWPDDYY